MVRLIILFLLLSFSSYGQTVQEAFSGYGDIQSITGSGPTYTITLNPFIGNPKFQPNGQYNGTDVSIGNVIWADCARYVIASVVSTSYSSMTVTATVPATDWALGITPPNPNQRVAIVTEIDGIPILPPTADGNGGALSSIDNILYACILAHQTKQLLIGKNSVNEITDYVGTTDVPPSPPASSYTGETWRNSVGEFYYSNGTQWLSDKEVKLTNTSLQGLSTGQYKIGIDTLGKDTMYLANNGIFRRFEAGGSNISFQLTTPPLGDLEITDGGGTLSVPILDIAPIQSVTGSNEISVSPSPGGTLSLDMPSQGASSDDIFRWDGSGWQPSTFIRNYPLVGNATLADPLKIDDGFADGHVLMWDGVGWGSSPITTNATLSGIGTSGNPLKIAQQGATSGQVLKWNGTTWLPSADAGGISTLNGLTPTTQTFATGTTGTDFGISSATSTHTFNLPIASAINTGKLSSTDWTTFNNKVTNAGTGVNNQWAYWTGANTLSTSNLLKHVPTGYLSAESANGFGLPKRTTVNTNAGDIYMRTDLGNTPYYTYSNGNTKPILTGGAFWSIYGGSYSDSKQYIPEMNSIMYGTNNIRWVKTTSGGTGPGQTHIVTFTLNTPFGNLVYPFGRMTFSHYYNRIPQSISVRVQLTNGTWYGPYNVDLTKTLNTNNTGLTSFPVYFLDIGGIGNFLNKIEITTVGDAVNGIFYGTYTDSGFDYFPDSPEGIYSPYRWFDKGYNEYLPNTVEGVTASGVSQWKISNNSLPTYFNNIGTASFLAVGTASSNVTHCALSVKNGTADNQSYFGINHRTIANNPVFATNGLGQTMIGTESPASLTTRAVIHGLGSTSSTSSFAVHNSTGTNNGLVVRDDGMVGIGTASPASLPGFGRGLNIHTSDGLPNVHLSNPGGSWCGLGLDNSKGYFYSKSGFNISYNVTAGQTQALSFINGTTGTLTRTFWLDGAAPGKWSLGKNAVVQVNTDGYILGSDNSSSTLNINCANAAGTSLFAVRNDGKVGIGTGTPTGLLTVKDNGAGGYIAEIHANNSTPWLAGWFNDTYSTTNPAFTYFARNDGSWEMGTQAGKTMTIFQAYGTPRLTMLSSGDFRVEKSLGVGGINPTALIHTKAGTATASTAPFKFTVTGAVLNTTPEVGALEVDAANRIYYVGASGTRNTIAYLSDVATTVSMKEESFTATAAQTTFTIAYSAPAPSGTSMPIRVYRNGVRLKYVSSGPTSTQFTYTTTTITTTANAAGDEIVIEYLN